MNESCRKEVLLEELVQDMEQMYYAIEREKSNRHIEYITNNLQVYKEPMNGLSQVIAKMGNGRIQRDILQSFKNEESSFQRLQTDINTKFKIYVRGLGNSGKSTLVNALLAISEEIGSERDKKPLTFTRESFSNEIPKDQAMMTWKGEDGYYKSSLMSREKAKKLADKEREEFDRSMAECRRHIKEKCKGVINLKEREEIRDLIYHEKLMKTNIEEIKWGIGENRYLDNCILVDTPGLRQELRFSNELEDVRNYEADGVIWVISSEKINSRTLQEEYKKELEDFSGLKNIAVINMHDEEIIYGSKEWGKLIEQAGKKFVGEFDYVIGVNNLLAFEGNLESDTEKIQASNIEELRTLINKMFSEKSSEDILKDHVNKVNRFFQKYDELILRSTQQEIMPFLKKYNETADYIAHRANGLRSECRNKIHDVVNDYIRNMKNRVNSSLSQINSLDTAMKREDFLNNSIICSEELSESLLRTRDYLEYHINKEFNTIYRESVVSKYNYRGYEDFLRRNNKREDLLAPKKIDIRVSYQSREDVKKSIETTINQYVGGFLSGSIVSATAGIFASISNYFDDKSKNIINMVMIQANASGEKYLEELQRNIEKYQEDCYQVRELSFQQELGTYQDVKEALTSIPLFQKEITKLEFLDLNLNEIIFGETKI